MTKSQIIAAFNALSLADKLEVTKALFDVQQDYGGAYVAYTNLYRWKDGSLHEGESEDAEKTDETKLGKDAIAHLAMTSTGKRQR